MVAPPPAPEQNNLPPEGGLVQNALLGMKYKYVREQPTTLVVTITPQGKGHPVSLLRRASRQASLPRLDLATSQWPSKLTAELVPRRGRPGPAHHPDQVGRLQDEQ